MKSKVHKLKNRNAIKAKSGAFFNRNPFHILKPRSRIFTGSSFPPTESENYIFFNPEENLRAHAIPITALTHSLTQLLTHQTKFSDNGHLRTQVDFISNSLLRPSLRFRIHIITAFSRPIQMMGFWWPYEINRSHLSSWDVSRQRLWTFFLFFHWIYKKYFIEKVLVLFLCY